ncbi:MAG: hypothetical protein WCE52_10495 [Candidatus Acidiferrum sp.]
MFCLALGGWLFLGHHPAHALTEKDTIVLGDFTNTTGDAMVAREGDVLQV